MEKIGTKKLLLTSIFLIVLSFVVMFGFAACGDGKVELTEDNLVGTYDVTNAAFTPTAENQYNRQAATCTKAEFDAIKAKVDAGTDLTADEEYKYFEVFDGFFERYGINENKTVTVDNQQRATWAIENGELTYESTLQGNINWTFAVEWDNGKVVVTITVPNSQGATMAGTMVLTLEKVTA